MFTFTVRPDGGEPFEVTATTRDVLQWEKTAKGVTLAKLQENAALRDLYAIAHFAARRTHQFTGGLEQFEESCDIEVHDTEEDQGPDPTSAAR